MKKILFVIMFMPIVVFGMTCDPIVNSDTSKNRTLTCDATKSTTTSYKTDSEYEVLKNSVCTIKCTEEILFSIDPIQKVLAGTSFNYPLYASGIRKCTAVYNYADYETKITRLVNEYNSLTGSEKTTKGNEITNYYHEKKLCDNFKVDGSENQNKYTYNGNVSIKIETSTSEVTVPYVFKETSYDNVVMMEEEVYNACNYNETSRKCLGDNKTVVGWSETSTLFGKYTMNDVFLEKHTGEVKNVNSSNTCNAGDRYFVSLTEITKPVNTDPNDKGYRLTLTANNIGNNLGQSNNVWNLNVNCWYQVENLIFPGKTDENNEEYEGTAFQYRLIDLDNPFPGRSPGFNWAGKEDIIYSTKDNLSSLQKFVITLNRSSINKIREYNDVYPYDTFNLTEMEQSKFIESNTNIIDRR